MNSVLHHNKRYLLPLVPLATYTYGSTAYESAKDYIPEVDYYKFTVGLALVLGIYHAYYRLSKFCFKPTFLMKYTENPALIKEYHARVLAITTCTLVTLIACCYHVPNIAQHFFDLETIFNLRLAGWDKFIMYCLFGYLVHDLVWCMTHEWHDVLNYVHHAVSIWFCVATLIVNNAAFESAIGLTLAESSNVFLHLRWFIKFFRGRNSVFFDCLFAFVFFVTRIIGGTWITYWLIKVDGPLTVRVMCYLLDVLNVGFFFQIVGMIRRQLKKRKQQATQIVAKEGEVEEKFEEELKEKVEKAVENEGGDQKKEN